MDDINVWDGENKILLMYVVCCINDEVCIYVVCLLLWYGVDVNV